MQLKLVLKNAIDKPTRKNIRKNEKNKSYWLGGFFFKTKDPDKIKAGIKIIYLNYRHCCTFWWKIRGAKIVLQMESLFEKRYFLFEPQHILYVNLGGRN